MKFKEFANSFWLLFIILVSVNLSGCANLVTGALAMRKADSEQAKKDASQKPQLTQLQTRQLQTRNYQTEDTKIILQTALAVLQDDGFVVQNANVDLGLLAASKSLQDINVDSSGKAFLKGFFWIRRKCIYKRVLDSGDDCNGYAFWQRNTRSLISASLFCRIWFCRWF